MKDRNSTGQGPGRERLSVTAHRGLGRTLGMASGGALGAAMLAGLAAASPYDGTFRVGPESDCSRIGTEGGALRIEDGLFEGIESQCRMTRPVDVVDMDATLYTMECSAGDTRWTERALLMTAAEADGLIMLWNGYAFRYDRCSPEAIAAAGDGDAADADADETEAAADAGERGMPPPRVLLPRIELPSVETDGADGADEPRAIGETAPDDAVTPDAAETGEDEPEETEAAPAEDAEDAEARGGTSARAKGAGGAG